VLEYKEFDPTAVLLVPVVSDARALVPNDVLFEKANELNKKTKKRENKLNFINKSKPPRK
jgi:hypothetical protein